MDDVFASLRQIYATSALLKREWTEQWNHRAEVDLPPKYEAERYLYSGATDAAIDAMFGRAILYRNRWQSQIKPLFDTYETETWSQVRAMIERSSPAFVTLREEHRSVFHADEASWINRAIEGLDEARYIIRRSEQEATETSDLIARSTYQTLYTVLQLSETMLDGLRREAEDR